MPPTSSPSPPHAARPIIGIGRVLLWGGGSLWIGRQTGLARAHAHHAIQLTLAMHGRFGMDDDSGAGWQDHAGVLVLPHRRHRFDGRGSDLATIFIEPEMPLGRALLALQGERTVTAIEDGEVARLVAPLRKAFEGGAGDATLSEAAQRLVHRLAGLPAAASHHVPMVDPRVERTMAWMPDRLPLSITITEAAAQAHLSPSRFRHLFAAQAGITFRAWLLWTRMAAAMGAGMRDQTWTAAAHFSRTCRRMFGIAPAMLVRAPEGECREVAEGRHENG